MDIHTDSATLPQKFAFTEDKTHSVVFMDGNKTVGTLRWDGGRLRFQGDAEASALIFFDRVIRQSAPG